MHDVTLSFLQALSPFMFCWGVWWIIKYTLYLKDAIILHNRWKKELINKLALDNGEGKERHLKYESSFKKAIRDYIVCLTLALFVTVTSGSLLLWWYR